MEDRTWEEAAQSKRECAAELKTDFELVKSHVATCLNEVRRIKGEDIANQLADAFGDALGDAFHDEDKAFEANLSIYCADDLRDSLKDRAEAETLGVLIAAE